MTSYILTTLAYLVARYLHIVCATILVGGTLFYEMVVPAAIDELRVEQQLLIFARARLFFKRIVWGCSALIVLSGIFSSYVHWQDYNRDHFYRAEHTPKNTSPDQVMELTPVARPGWWWAAHSSTGAIAVLIALSLTIGKVPPSQPIRWMRLNLVILMLVMFLATVTRQTRLEAGSSAPPAHAMEPVELPPR